MDLRDKPYLSMDWKNNASWSGSVMVTSRVDGFLSVDGDPGANAVAHRLAINPQYQQQVSFDSFGSRAFVVFLFNLENFD